MSQSDIIAQTLERARDKRIFKALIGIAWRNKLFQILCLKDRQVDIERFGSFIFGIVTFGFHCTGYVERWDGLNIRAPRRAHTKPTYGAVLDKNVVGGIAIENDSLANLVEEAFEEASLPADMVCTRVQTCGTVSDCLIQTRKKGEESGLLQLIYKEYMV